MMSPPATAADRARLRDQVRAAYPTTDDTHARSFIATCRTIMRSATPDAALAEVQSRGLHHARAMAQKAAQSGSTLDESWGSEGGRELAAHYLASVRDHDALGLLSLYARTIPSTLRRVLIASGHVAGAVGEALPKAVRHLDLTGEPAPRIKVAGVIVMSRELADSADPEARALFEGELEAATVAGCNRAVVDAFDTTAIGAGADAAADLAAALAAAEPSRGYVVVADHAVVHELSLASDGRMPIHGGEYVPGVHVIGYEATTDDPRMIVLPASRVALVDYGLSVQSARHASVEMADDPSQPAELVSLWQTGSVGLLVEREFSLVAAAPAVTVA